MTWIEYYRHYLQQLQSIYSLEEAAVITSVVFENKTGVSKSQIIKSPNEILNNDHKTILDTVLTQLLIHKPVQQVTGEAWFYNLKFAVNEYVLIPRPETEELAKWIIEEHTSQNKKLSILDIGSGSGCIGVALKKNLPATFITSIDVSEEALLIAKQNAINNKTVIEFLQIDFLDQSNWQRLPVFDIIVSNPPYIPLSEKEKLDKNVCLFEPHSALFVPDNNPLIFYETIATFAKTHLKQNGKIYVETHEELANETAAVFSGISQKVEIRKDINGNERMIKVTQTP